MSWMNWVVILILVLFAAPGLSFFGQLVFDHFDKGDRASNSVSDQRVGNVADDQI